jgi:hypothetical protein
MQEDAMADQDPNKDAPPAQGTGQHEDRRVPEERPEDDQKGEKPNDRSQVPGPIYPL